MRPGNTVQMESHAVATLRYIRESMDAAGSVAVPGSAGIALGAIGLAAALLASTPALRSWWLLIWLAAAVAGAAAGGAIMARQSALHGALFGAPLRKLVLCLLPGIFAGAVLTAVHWQSGNLHAIPGTWLLLYGCALVSTSAPTARIVGVLGALFVTLGLVAFWLPDELHIVALGAGFGGLHLVFGLLIGRKRHGRQG
ncbi:MAG: hypothetical protein WAK94_11735 [Steroidobacteraceae bacterium]